MDYTAKEVLQFVKENDVKFIRLAFCDIFGTLKNVSIMPGELPRAFSCGISIDGSVIRRFMSVERSELFLVPDPATLSVLPWRPAHSGVVRMFCDIKKPDGSAFEGDSRAVLKRAVAAAAEMGYTCRFGTECEFYLFQTNEQQMPTMTPFDRGSYCDVAPLDRGENVRREICLSLEEMGMFPETSHHEQGPGQNEIDFKYADALTAADNLIAFKSAVKSIAAINGLYASFMPKPFPNQSGSGLHVNMSLSRGGMNLFKESTTGHSAEAESFMAGILHRAVEITAFANPLTNSYNRFGSFEAPKYVTWSHQNCSQLIRIPAADGEYTRMELRSPDTACNPYFTFALLIAAGLDGIKARLPLPAPVDLNLFELQSVQDKTFARLPATLEEAVEIAWNSDFIRRVIPLSALEKYCEAKREEYQTVVNADNPAQAEHDLYFSLI